MDAFKQKVVKERDELNVRLQSLQDFITKPSMEYEAVPNVEKIRLHKQLTYMTEYSNILDIRLASQFS